MSRRYPCPMCRKEMLLEKVHEGFEVPCPGCGHRFLVPAGATDAAAPPPPPAAPVRGSSSAHVPKPRRGNADDGTTAMVVGLVAIVLCQLLGPVAWYMGHKLRAEARANREEPPGLATAGWVLGIVATVLLFLTACFVGVFFAFGVASGMR